MVSELLAHTIAEACKKLRNGQKIVQATPKGSPLAAEQYRREWEAVP